MNNHNSMDPAPKCLNSLGEVSCVGQSDKWFCVPQTLRISERDVEILLGFPGQILKYGQMLFVRVQLASREQEILSEIAVVESRNGGFVRGLGTDQEGGCARVRQKLQQRSGIRSGSLVKGKQGHTFVAASTPVSSSTKRRSSGFTNSPTLMCCQSRPAKAGSADPAVGGLFSRSCIWAWENER